MTSTGFSSHTLVRLCSSRLARIHTQTTRTSRAGGQTHPQRIHHGVRGHEHQHPGHRHEDRRRHGPALRLVGEPCGQHRQERPARGRSRTAPSRWRSSRPPCRPGGTGGSPPPRTRRPATRPRPCRRACVVTPAPRERTGSPLGGAVPLRRFMMDHLACRGFSEPLQIEHASGSAVRSPTRGSVMSSHADRCPQRHRSPGART